MIRLKVSSRDKDIYGTVGLYEMHDGARYRLTQVKWGERKNEIGIELKQPRSNRFISYCYLPSLDVAEDFLKVHSKERWNDVANFMEEIRMGREKWPMQLDTLSQN